MSAPLAEMIVAWNAVKATVLHVGPPKSRVEGDALGTILAIRSGLGVDGYSANLLQDINSWLQMLNERRVSHILREGNSLADFMAVGGSRESWQSM